MGAHSLQQPAVDFGSTLEGTHYEILQLTGQIPS